MLSSSLKIWIVLLGAIAGIIHLVVLNLRLVSAGYGVDVPFTLNGIGFLTLSALAMWRPDFLNFLKGRESLFRWAFIGFTAITIVAWGVLGDRGDLLGWATTLLEVVLLVLLVLDGRRSSVA